MRRRTPRLVHPTRANNKGRRCNVILFPFLRRTLQHSKKLVTLQRHTSLPMAMSSSPILRRSALLPVAPSASAANHVNAPIDLQDEFDNDDEWNDKDLAAIDLSVAMT